MSAKGNEGLGLVELMIAVGLLAGFMTVLARAHVSLLRVSSFEISSSSRGMRVDAGVHKLHELLRCARVEGVSPDGSSLFFQLAVDLDGDGGVVDPFGNLEWGVEANGAVSAGVMRVEFAAVDTLGEAEVRADLNGDGDRLDVFNVGQLRVGASNGFDRRLTGAWLLQPSAALGSDIDGDGAGDPIFSVLEADGAVSVRLNIFWLGGTSEGPAFEQTVVHVPIINQEAI